jgi:SAM-dependent methyltransferase
MSDPRDGRPTADDVLGIDHGWYHVVNLADGRSTPGWIDLRAHVGVPPIPQALHGKRALDMGTFDGFWAFELERRGAEVVALDIDEIPPPDTPRIHVARMRAEAAGATPGMGFHVLRAHLGSQVRRVSLNAYDLTAEAVGGPVDVVFFGALLLHLRDPVGALERALDVLVPGGTIVLFEPVGPAVEKLKEPAASFLAWQTPWTWWQANTACMLDWLRAAGFSNPLAGNRVKVKDLHGGRHVIVGFEATAPG